VSLICVSHHQDEIPRAVGHVLHLADGEVKRVERRLASIKTRPYSSRR
jgi:ABC-type molybdenum transport system ATPase subunit/photorepair protein PhrA